MTDSLIQQVRDQARGFGFQDLGISDVDPGHYAQALERWLSAGYHGEMEYMARHGRKRSHPAELEPGTCRVISVRMNYWSTAAAPAGEVLANQSRAYISRYALGRDYHKLLRQRLRQLVLALQGSFREASYRIFVDSGPVMERGFAQKAGLGWIGKNTMLIHPREGSWFFLGEILTDAPLPRSPPFQGQHCGSCSACQPACPTGAFVQPWVLDARRCLSYLTIEQSGPIPLEFRKALGNRVFGCDDCQLVCPFNRTAPSTAEPDFRPRHGLDGAALADLFRWSAEDFDERTRGSPIRRTGYRGWLRNLAIGLGNAPSQAEVLSALRSRADDPDALIREHVRWALEEHRKNALSTAGLP